MSEVYEVAELYERSRKIEGICTGLFWANCALTALAFWPITIQPIVVYGQIATAALHVVLGLVNDCALWFDAESANRKHLIEDAFGVDITNRRSEGYYNNRFGRSVERYVTNAFESSYFTMRVSEAMMPTSAGKTIAACLLFLLLLLLQPTEISLSDVTQAVFSAYLIEDAVLLISFHSKVKAVYERFYETMVSTSATEDDLPLLVANVQEYECVKAYFKVRLDSERFNKMNDELSSMWSDIERRISFDRRLDRR